MIGAIGTVLAHKYCLIEEIGHGGNGHVYLALDYALGKRWAVKELSQEHEIQQQEANVLKNLEHQMLPRIVDRLEEKGKVYIVMDYLEGVSLGSLLRQKRRFSCRQVIAWSIRFCDVLEYLHTRKPQVIYRDLKPDNILLTKEGDIKLVDFGCACFYEEAGGNHQTFVGSKGFAAPEQYAGISTPVTDIYGLGATIEALSTKRVRKRLKKIIRKCKKENPQKRYQSVGQLRKILEQMQDERRRGSRIRKVCVLMGLVVVFFGIIQNILQKAQEHLYYEALEERRYQDAIEIFADEELAYQKLLDHYVGMGETKKGIETVEYLRSLYFEETKGHQKILQEIGKLYFKGNVLDEEFSVDYEKALEYFNITENSGNPNIACYRRIAQNLCQFGSNVAWDQMRKDLEQMENACFLISDTTEKIRQYEAVSAIYLSNRYYLNDNKVNPLEKGIEMLEICQEIIRLGNFEIRSSSLAIEVQMSLARASCLRGMEESEESAKYLDRSCELYENVLEDILEDRLRTQIMMNIAYIKRSKGCYKEAADWYEKIIAHNPNAVETYCTYGLMELLDKKDVTRANELYQKAKIIPGSQENQNFRVLKKRLEAI